MEFILVNKVWDKFCIVGLGNHAKNRIIPALTESKKDITGLVTSKPKRKILSCNHFLTVDEALINLSKSTVFVIVTPPKAHYKQAKQILDFGRDVVIEKPGFVKYQDIEEIIKSKNFEKNIVFEAFMYKYSTLYEKFLVYWKNNYKEIVSITSNFYIPSIPKNSFRDQNDITSSCLYDMGCYGMSLLSDIDIDVTNINISEVEIKNGKLNLIKLVGIYNHISININFGLSNKYENVIKIVKKNNNTVRFWPFFKGVEEKKFIEEIYNSESKFSEINDLNAFSKMFNIDRQKLLKNQKLRFNKMLKISKKLNSLEKELKFSIKTNY